jgi:hypothetical protein
MPQVDGHSKRNMIICNKYWSLFKLENTEKNGSENMNTDT